MTSRMLLRQSCWVVRKRIVAWSFKDCVGLVVNCVHWQLLVSCASKMCEIRKGNRELQEVDRGEGIITAWREITEIPAVNLQNVWPMRTKWCEHFRTRQSKAGLRWAMHIWYNLYYFWLQSVMSLLYGWAQVAINQLVTQREDKKWTNT